MFFSVVKLAPRTCSKLSVAVTGAFIPGVPVQPVLLRYPNKLVSEQQVSLRGESQALPTAPGPQPPGPLPLFD